MINVLAYVLMIVGFLSYFYFALSGAGKYDKKKDSYWENKYVRGSYLAFFVTIIGVLLLIFS